MGFTFIAHLGVSLATRSDPSIKQPQINIAPDTAAFFVFLCPDITAGLLCDLRCWCFTLCGEQVKSYFIACFLPVRTFLTAVNVLYNSRLDF